MSTPRIEQAVVDFVTEAGKRVEEPAVPGELRVGGAQVDLVVREDGRTWTAELFERGASNGVRLVTSDEGVLQRYLLLWAGGSWRSAHGLGFLQTQDTPPAEGCTVVEESPGVFGVQGSDGTWLARELLDVDARELATSIGYPLDDVLAAYRHRTGAPVFSGGRRWFRGR